MLKKIKISTCIFFALLTAYSVYLSAFFVIHGEVHLKNDTGRDFLLLQELEQKKIVLIGARANTRGVFHGPLWTYINYPAYLIGHGNPVSIAWFWIILEIIFLATTYIILSKLFKPLTALIGTSLFSINLIPQINTLFGQQATFFFMPFFLYAIYSYLKSKKARYLALHMLTTGILIQMNIGAGMLFAILSLLLTAFFITRHKLWRHLFALIFLPLAISNFILFDIRHDFNITKALLDLSSSSKFIIPLNQWLINRFDNLISMQLYYSAPLLLMLATFSLMLIFTILKIRKGSGSKIFLALMLFYYFGYMLLSYFNKGIMLFDHLYPLSAIAIIWITALTRGVSKIIFIPLAVIAIYLNFTYSTNYISQEQNSFIGKSPDSWIALKTVADYIIRQQKGKEFGYFVYSPDAYAYQQRYAMSYAFTNAGAKSNEYIKGQTTYIIAAPPPKDNPYMQHQWWITNETRISKKPSLIKKFPGGYTIEKFDLTPDEQKIPYDPNIRLGLSFR